jgi:hypothetical protein
MWQTQNKIVCQRSLQELKIVCVLHLPDVNSLNINPIHKNDKKILKSLNAAMQNTHAFNQNNTPTVKHSHWNNEYSFLTLTLIAISINNPGWLNCQLPEHPHFLTYHACV